MGCEASRSSSRRKQTRECPAPVCKAVWVRWDKIPAFWRWVRSLDLTLPHRVRLAALNSVADRAFGSQAQERAGQQHRRPAVHHDVHRGPQGVCRGPPRWDDRGADSRHRRTSARVCDSRRHCLGAHQVPKPLLGDGRGSQPARESSCVLRGYVLPTGRRATCAFSFECGVQRAAAHHVCYACKQRADPLKRAPLVGHAAG